MGGVYCLGIGVELGGDIWRGMVLVRIDKDDGEVVFRRVGLFKSTDKNWFVGFGEDTFTVL